MTPGATCGACGHHHIADEERAAAMNSLRDHLDGVKARLTAPFPSSAAAVVDVSTDEGRETAT